MNIIDFHCHIYPEIKLLSKLNIDNNLGRVKGKYLDPIKLKIIDLYLNQSKESPLLSSIAEEVAVLHGISNIVLESNYNHFLSRREGTSIGHSLVIAQPPFASNSFVKNLCSKDSTLTPVHYISGKKSNYIKSQSIFKMHPLNDQASINSKFYLKALSKLNERQEPAIVIIHTGKIGAGLFFRKKELGDAAAFENYFSEYKNINFVLAHMNLTDSSVVAGLCKKYSNVYATSSWQGSDSILSFVKEASPEKLLFSTDWPTVGSNFDVSNRTIAKLEKHLSKGALDKFLFNNAKKLLKAVSINVS